ncbi:MAG: HNH endonuclease [Actinomycetota bacterium]|nr:HNH endonuclease [Actinomycetota bacterium]
MSREHIFPEAIGNADLAMLPPGVVCDRCNNGPLAALDQTLCAYLPIAMRRTVLGMTNKAGKRTALRFAQGRVEPMLKEEVAPGDSNGLRIVDPGPRHTLVRDVLDGDEVRLRLEGHGGRRLNPRFLSELSRSVLKIGFELSFLDHDDMLLNSSFDRVRDAILGVGDHSGALALALSGDPDDVRLQSSYMLDEISGLGAVAVNILGVQLMTHAGGREFAPTPGFFIGRF